LDSRVGIIKRVGEGVQGLSGERAAQGGHHL
jgi:hypothetical protein